MPNTTCAPCIISYAHAVVNTSTAIAAPVPSASATAGLMTAVGPGTGSGSPPSAVVRNRGRASSAAVCPAPRPARQWIGQHNAIPTDAAVVRGRGGLRRGPVPRPPADRNTRISLAIRLPHAQHAKRPPATTRTDSVVAAVSV